MTTFDELEVRARAWMATDPDPETRARTAAMLSAGDEAGLRAAFGEVLRFGTAGIRGTLGPGPGHMNRALIRRVSAGVARYLVRTVAGARARGVVIGHDARRGSEVFAADAAQVLAAEGIRVIRCGLAPTPLVAFALRELGAAAGVVVTASHNPPEYNGYKVYWHNGAQIVPPVDAGIAAEIDAADEVTLDTRGIEDAPADLGERYLRALRDQIAHVPRGDRPAVVVYTPLHGVGAALCEPAMVAEGVTVCTVPEQREPDGAFPTVAFPNPEEAGALDLAEALAAEVNADLVVANDPDADRLAACVPGPDGRLVRLTGDELGALLGDALLETAGGAGAVVATTFVSSDLLGLLAAERGAECVTTLTGFKWIWNQALERVEAGGRFVFGYEEALGYSVGPAVRDKDGIGAAMLLCRLARGPISLADRLAGIRARHGLIATRQKSLSDYRPGGAERMAALMVTLRDRPPARIGESAVVRRRDLLTEPVPPMPPSDMLMLWLQDDSRIVVRPSGTEPKLKLYLQVREPDGPDAAARASARLDALVAAATALVAG